MTIIKNKVTKSQQWWKHLGVAAAHGSQTISRRVELSDHGGTLLLVHTPVSHSDNNVMMVLVVRYSQGPRSSLPCPIMLVQYSQG